MRIISKSNQAYGAFNNGQIIENKPIGFPQDGGFVRPYSNLFYWARAEAVIDSTIGLHPHKGFEIMSFVLEGKIRHYDTLLDTWKELNAGDAQIIRAGNGIQHAEHMARDAVMFQIWFDPNLDITISKNASYDDYASSNLPVMQDEDAKVKTYIGTGSPITLDTPGINIKRITVVDGSTFKQDLENGRIYSIYVLSGTGKINGDTIETDDFVILEGKEGFLLENDEEPFEFFQISSPVQLDYRTYHETIQTRFV